ncbi:MAG: VCBS repeat-containing protein [Polyangiaceae bacterium]
MFLSSGSDFVRDGSWTTAGQGALGWFAGDFNGDGKDDLLRKLSLSSSNQVLLSTGSSFASPVTWLATTNTGVDGWHVGDYNGDGKDDILRTTESGGTKLTEVFLSTGSSFVAGGTWATLDDGDDGWYTGRFNGDAHTDVFRYIAGQAGAHVGLSSGVSFSFVPLPGGAWTMAGHSDIPFEIGDFDGDGKDDILRMLAGTGTQVFRSTGSSFASTGTWTPFEVTDRWYVGDFNGDGKDDIFRHGDFFAGAEVMVSSGSAFAFTGDWTVPEIQ